MATLLLAEHDGTTLNEVTARALSAAAALGGPVDILVAGENVRAVAEAAARLAGIRAVRLADGAALAHLRAEPFATLLVQLAIGYDAIVAPATATMKNVMPRLAALLDVMQVSGVVKVLAPDTFERPIYAGNALETVRSRDSKRLLTIRAAAFPVAPSAGAVAPIEAVAVPPDDTRSTWLGAELTRSGRPDLVGARIVVSGGRALGSAEQFSALLGPLADRLGAALGASRAAVDGGYAASDLQVGQTGKVVAPELYLAFGISGAIQHLAGMKESRVIVAVNSDPDAPIFQVADFGLVGDLFEVIPEMLAALK